MGMVNEWWFMTSILLGFGVFCFVFGILLLEGGESQWPKERKKL